MRRPLAPFLTAVLPALLLTACGEADRPDDAVDAIRPPEIVRTVPAAEALSGAHIPTLDPATMNAAEIRHALGGAPHCEFRYTAAGRPVLAVALPSAAADPGGIVKLNGSLIPLTRTTEGSDTVILKADRITLRILPDGGEPNDVPGGMQRREADLTFDVTDELTAGYRGWLDCPADLPRVADGS